MIHGEWYQVNAVVEKVFGSVMVSTEFGSCRFLMRPGGHGGECEMVGRIGDGQWLLWRWDSDVDCDIVKRFVLVWC